MKLVNPRQRPGTVVGDTVVGDTVVGHCFVNWKSWALTRRSWTYPARGGRGVGLRITVRRKREAD